MALVFTQSDLDALKAAYVTGALEVQIGDRRVKYRSQAELLSAMKSVQDYLDGISDDVDENPSVIKAGFSRGGT